MINIEIILGIIAAVLLIAYSRTRNAVWGGLMIGIIVGFIIAVVIAFMGSGFNWLIIGKSAIVGTLLGFAAELLGKVSDLIRRDKNN